MTWDAHSTFFVVQVSKSTFQITAGWTEHLQQITSGDTDISSHACNKGYNMADQPALTLL